MKRFLTLLLASLLGGIVSVLSYIKITETYYPNNQQVHTEQGIQSPNKITQINKDLDFTKAAEKTTHAVVHVKIRSQVNKYDNPIYNFLFGKPSYSKQDMPIVSSGSGVIISEDGYIVTNNHVIKGADALEVTLNDQRTFNAKVIGTDPTTDIALIKIEGSNFPYLKWGNSDKIQVGEWVLAVGNPFNLASTVTAGIVSAKSRSINIINKHTAIESFIQTDAAVNPGNSGGALVNTKGELIGINTAIASPTGSFSGYSFAVPECIAKKVVSDLIEFGSVQRAIIGVSILNINSQQVKKYGVTRTNGVFIYSVIKNGAAHKAGLKSGDIIIKINDKTINKPSDLQATIGILRPKDKINITIIRNNKKQTLPLILQSIYG